MKDTVWLVVNRRYVSRVIKTATKRPALNQGEYAVLVTVEVPDSVFEPRALPSARIVVPESAVVAADVVVSVESPPEDQPRAASQAAECEARHPESGARCIFVAGHAGTHFASTRGGGVEWSSARPLEVPVSRCPSRGPDGFLCMGVPGHTGDHWAGPAPGAWYEWPNDAGQEQPGGSPLIPGNGAAAPDEPEAEAYDYAADDRNYDAARERGR